MASANDEKLEEVSEPQEKPGFSSSTTNPPIYERLRKRQHATFWTLEILSMALAIAVTVALVIVLKERDGKSPDFNSAISLNTVVAALSTVASSCFTVGVGTVTAQYTWIWFTSRKSHNRLKDMNLFAEASGGVLGSIKLLWRLKYRLSLVTLGAVLTILTLGFDIFTQQLVGLQSISQTVTNATGSIIGTVPRVSLYQDASYIGTSSGVLPSTDMVSSMFGGLLGTTAPNFTISCATGNCTWPSIPTLGVCGECRNLTYDTDCHSTGCNLTTESGASIHYTPAESSGTTFMMQAYDSLGTDVGYFYNISSESTAYLAVFDIIAAEPFSFSWANITAAECALWACMQEYNVESNLGNQSENMTSTWSNVTVDAFASEDAVFKDIPSSWNVNSDQQYSVGYASIQGMQTELGTILTGKVTIDEDAEYTLSEQYLQVVWNLTTTDVNSWISNFAQQLTYTMRSTYSETTNATDTQYYAGTMYKDKIVVQVQWLWMIPIAVIVLASALYLVLGIIQTYRSGVGAWQSDLLTMLFTNTDSELRSLTLNHEFSSDAIQDAVGKQKVFIEKEDSGGWIFRAA